MRVRPGCRVGEVHLLDWSQLNFYCFPTYCTTPLSISISALFKLGSNSWFFNGYFHWNIVEKHFHGAFHSFVLTSSLLNPSFSFLALRTWRGASETKLVLRGIARYYVVLRAWYWEPEVGHLRQAWLGTFAQTWRSHEVPSLPLLPAANRILIWFRNNYFLAGSCQAL